jgi:bcr-type benzoyl-CoA reductase subunit C
LSTAGQNWIDLIADPYPQWQSRYPGRRAFGYLCPYAPLELLHAAGFAPVRLMQLSGPVVLANAHLPSFACALVRTVTERMLSGELDFLDGVLFVHTCDTMQCAADIWRMAKPRFRVLNFSLPSVLHPASFAGSVLSQPSAHDYVLAELRGLASALQSAFGAGITEPALRASIALYNEQRRLLASLYEHRQQVTVDWLWSLTLAGMVMPVEEHIAVLRAALHQPEEDTAGPPQGPAVILVGAVLDNLAIPHLITELGGQVVGDDLCTGSRYFDTLADEQEEPYASLAKRYLQRPPCPAKHDEARPRAQRLLELVHSSRAQGVIFVLPKFCDPHAFDYVPLAKALADASVPHLLIETDITVPAGQLRTRVQAFLEMLGHVPEDRGPLDSTEP